MPAVVTLLTDFGTEDHFVGAMKGVVLSRCPDAALVDMTHAVPPQDVAAGAFLLLAGFSFFPAGTVHVAVVDPGVGSARRALVAEAAGHRFVAPDNGLLSYVLDRDPGARLFHATDDRLFVHPVSATFHGRDVFAPVAAALACGTPAHAVGPRVDDPVRLAPIAPERRTDGSVEGRVLHVDHFGNVVTSLAPADLPPRFRLVAGTGEVGRLQRFYAEPGTAPGDLFAIAGSAGFVEVVAFRASAAARLGVRAGDGVRVVPE